MEWVIVHIHVNRWCARTMGEAGWGLGRTRNAVTSFPFPSLLWRLRPSPSLCSLSLCSGSALYCILTLPLSVSVLSLRKHISNGQRSEVSSRSAKLRSPFWCELKFPSPQPTIASEPGERPKSLHLTRTRSPSPPSSSLPPSPLKVPPDFRRGVLASDGHLALAAVDAVVAVVLVPYHRGHQPHLRQADRQPHPPRQPQQAHSRRSL